MIEKDFETQVVSNLQKRYPGSFVIKVNPHFIQGFPDRIFLYYNFWAAFDTKIAANSQKQPNQTYYIETLDKLSFATFVHPDNEMEFYNDIQRALEVRR